MGAANGEGRDAKFLVVGTLGARSTHDKARGAPDKWRCAEV